MGTSQPNPEAIAWYVEQANRLLEDQQSRSESLRTRAGQLAGFAGAVTAILGASAGDLFAETTGVADLLAASLFFTAMVCLAAAVFASVWFVYRPVSFAALSADEIDTYLTPRYQAADLWRVQVRTLRSLSEATKWAQRVGNEKSLWLTRATLLFLAGLAMGLGAGTTLAIDVIWS